MATKKKMLQAAAGNSGGAGGEPGLNVEDVFSTYLYEGNGSSQTIQNGIALGDAKVLGGSVEFDGVDDYLKTPTSSDFAFGTGDFTLEAWVYPTATSSTYGVVTTRIDETGNTNQVFFGIANGEVLYYASVAASGGSVPQNEWSHIACSRDGTTVRVFLNGVQVDSVTDNASKDTTFGYVGAGGGDNKQLFSGSISNARVVKGTAVYTSSFTPSTSALTDITNTVLLTCQGDTPFVDNSASSHTIAQNGNPTSSSVGPFPDGNGEGGLVWTKGRTQTVEHILVDTERGVQKYISSDRTNAEGTNSSILNSFNSNGFSIGGSSFVNSSGNDYASWTFRKAPKFFTCVTWSGDGTSNRAIPHDLGGAVGSYFVKCTNAATASDWIVWHKDLTSNAYNLVLNTTAAQDNYNLFSTTAPDSSNVYLGTSNLDYFNATGRTYVAYIFAHNDGDGGFGPTGDQDIIKCGSYTGTGAVGHFIDLGFEPQWLMTKRVDSAGNDWVMQDSMRSMSHSDYRWLSADTSSAESFGIEGPSAFDGTAAVYPTGYMINNSGGGNNSNGGEYIYIAIRRGAMGAPESGSEVYSAATYTGSATSKTVSAGIVPDMILGHNLSGGSSSGVPMVSTRVQGHGLWLVSSKDATETKYTYLYSPSFDGTAGTTTIPTESGEVNKAGDSHGMHFFKRAHNFLDVLTFEGTASSGNPQTESHNLGVVPEMMWVKCRDTAKDWQVYHTDLGISKKLILNSDSAELSAGVGAWNTAPTATSFTVGDDSEFSGGGRAYMAYLFASLDNVSKVGSFSHTSGSPTNVDCGFTNGARFVLWKKYSNTDGWQVYDTTRGIVSGSDPFLQLNLSGAQTTNEDLIDPYAQGFTVSANKNSGNYIFYAIA